MQTTSSGRRIRAALAVLFAPGCFLAGAVLPIALEASEKQTLRHLDNDRTFWLHLPEGTSDREETIPGEPLPLVVALHGAMMNGEMMEGLSRFSELSDETGDFAVVYPSGDPRGGIGMWDFYTPRLENEPEKGRVASGRDDLGFLLALIEHLVAKRIADRDRIFLSGMSNGAFFANRFALEFPDRIAALGLVAGTLPRLMADAVDAEPATPLPLIYFHGTEDQIVGIDGSDFLTRRDFSLPADGYVRWWARRNGVSDSRPEKKVLPDHNPDDGCRVEHWTWESSRYPVSFYRILGGGHTWPGGPETQPVRLLGPIPEDIDATLLMWDFFRAVPRDQLPRETP